ncbi:hypothetical protein GLGCALEP_02967 [Pseudomonas sp. MM221]|nr:hypothetical protein GLGCALEP_02967 [Pseudomonas sp. MM221]
MSRSSTAAPRDTVSRAPQAYETSSPTPADLRRYLRFSDEDARIWLDDQSMVMLHSSALGALRRELIESVGREGARRILMRIGYSAGSQDAALVRKRWPASDERSHSLPAAGCMRCRVWCGWKRSTLTWTSNAATSTGNTCGTIRAKPMSTSPTTGLATKPRAG